MTREVNPNETLDEIELHLKQAQAKLASERDVVIAAEIDKALCQVPRLRDEISILKQSLEDRKIIEQAKGILMRRSSLSEKEAHARLQKHSVSSGTKIVENAKLLIAAEAIMDGEK